MEAYKTLESEYQKSQVAAAETEKKLTRKLREMGEVQELNQQVSILPSLTPSLLHSLDPLSLTPSSTPSLPHTLSPSLPLSLPLTFPLWLLHSLFSPIRKPYCYYRSPALCPIGCDMDKTLHCTKQPFPSLLAPWLPYLYCGSFVFPWFSLEQASYIFPAQSNILHKALGFLWCRDNL